MDTSKVTIGSKMKGCFKFEVYFDLFNISQSIHRATFDTGCSHSLISVNSLKLSQNILNTLQHDLLTDIDIPLAMGAGIESSLKTSDKIKECIANINNKKGQLKRQSISKCDAKKILENYINAETENILSTSKNVRYECKVENYMIDDMIIGDTVIRLSFNTENKNLIGMNIIKEIYTKILSLDGKVHLIAAMNKDLADNAEKELRINCGLDTEALEANYINRKL